MKLRSVVLEHLPGIDQRLSIDDFGDTINVITGPNAVGKTSFCRAVLELLWPTRGKSAPRYQVESRWQVSNEERRAEYTNGRVTWRQSGGKETNPPPLPDDHLKHCYLLGVGDLLQPATSHTDEEINKELRRRMAGGYDIDEVLASKKKLFGRTFGKTENQAVKAAEQRVRDVRKKQKTIWEQECTLEQLGEKRDLAREASRKLPKVELAIELAEAREQLSRQAAELDAFPGGTGGMDKLHSTSAERLKELIESHETAKQELKTAKQHRSQEEETIQQQDLPKGLVPEAALLEAQNKVRKLTALESDIRGAVEELNKAKSLRDLACRNLGSTSASEENINIGPDALDALNRFIKNAIKSPTEPSEAPILTAAIAGVSGLIAIFIDPPLDQGFTAIAIGTALIAFFLWIRDKRQSKKIETIRGELKNRFGLEPDEGSDLRLYEMAARVLGYRNAKMELAAAVANHASKQEEFTKCLGSLNKFFQDVEFAPCEDADRASAAIQDLVIRNGKLRTAIEKRDRAKEDEKKYSQAEEKASSSITRFYSDAEIEDGDRATFYGRLDKLEDYKKKASTCNQLSMQISGLKKQLSANDELLKLPVDDARERKDTTKTQAENLEEVNQQIGAIEGAVTDAKGGDALQSAYASKATATDALKQRLDESLEASAGALLLNEVKAQFEIESQPDVIRQAQKLFASFTNNKYELNFDRTSTFRAIDTSTKTSFAISELSDGTRVQLLLATRVAFAMEAERNNSLPLFLDETLSTADPERFDAVVRSLSMLEDRQIFYLSSDPIDVKRWRRSAPEIDIKEIDLERIRHDEAAIIDAAPITPSLPGEVLKPKGLSPEDYAVKIGVARLNPWEPVEALDLFHLMRDDLWTVYHLRDITRLKTVGQWRSLVQNERTHVLSDKVEEKLVTARCDLAVAIFDAWHTGRGKPISQQDLRNCGAVTDKYIESIIQVAKELEGDGQALLEFVKQRTDPRLKGFREKNVELLEDYLGTEGHLDPRSALDDAGRVSLVLEAVAEHVSTGKLNQREVKRLAEELWILMDA